MADIFRVKASGVAGADGRALLVPDFSSYLLGARGIVTRLIASIVETGAAVLRDTFTRTVAAGNWGTPDLGPAWVALEEAGTLSVNGARGVCGPTLVTRAAIASPIGLADMELLFAVTNVEPLGSSTDEVRALLRVQDAANYYWASWQPPLTVTLQIGRRLAGVETVLATMTKDSVTVPFNIRASIIGNALAMRAWNLFSTEPAAPDLTTTDGNIAAAGGAGCGFTSPGAGASTWNIDELVAASGAAIVPVNPSWRAFIGDLSNPTNLVDSSQGTLLSSWVPALVNGQPIFQGDVLTVVADGAPEGTEVALSCYLAVEKL